MSTLLEPFSIATFTTSDGYPLQFRHFPAQRRSSQGGVLITAAGVLPPRGEVVAIHGIQSHGGWYPRSCAQIATAGFEVFFLERRGCGLNTEKRGDIPSFRRALDDIAEFVKTLPTDKPRLMGAISWGGKLGVGFQYRHPVLVNGLALLCPGLFPKIQPRFFQRMWIARCALRAPTRMRQAGSESHRFCRRAATVTRRRCASCSRAARRSRARRATARRR